MRSVHSVVLALTCVGCGWFGPKYPVEFGVVPAQLAVVDGARLVSAQRFMVPSGPAFTDEQLAACASGQAKPGDLPLELHTVLVAPELGIVVSGVKVGDVDAGGNLSADEVKGSLHAQLFDQLLETREHMKSMESTCAPWIVAGEQPQTSADILFVLDERLRWQTVRSVMYTAGQAQFGDVYFVVEDPGAKAEPWPPFERLYVDTLESLGDDSPYHDPPLNLAVEVTTAGLRFKGRSPLIGRVHDETLNLPCSSSPCTSVGSFPLDATRALLARVKLSEPHDNGIIVVPSSTTSWSLVAKLMSAADHASDGSALFANPVLAHGPDGSDDPLELPFVPRDRLAEPHRWTSHSQIAVMRSALPRIHVRPAPEASR